MTDWDARLAAADLPGPVLERAKLELAQVANENSDRRELDRYLETLAAMPWERVSAAAPISLEVAKAILEKAHVGLERAKLRVLEEVAVRTIAPDAPQPLFFLVGPPYTGKAHFARTIAALFGRPFVTRSLAGVTTESDLRGRDRGAEHPHPGLFADALLEAGVRDPVIYLTEADELSISEGNPVDALLAAVEEKRRQTFLDRYLGIPLDLSRAMIILAGQGDSPLSPALAGHVTYLEFAGYTLDEKLAIAHRHLLPAQVASNGLSGRFRITDPALRDLIEGWTYEPGVGRLDARLNALVRAAALEIAGGQGQAVIETVELEAILGPRPVDIHGIARVDRVGVVNGLVMNATEGAVTAVEASAYHGHEEFIITGSIGPVMRESAMVAFSVVRQAQASRFALPASLFDGQTLHLHFPEGAVEKEGPSAGVAIAVAIFSRFAGIAVRHDVAMTGELSLEGQVLRIGGLKKKILGAHRAGARSVIIPAANKPDLADIPAEVRVELEIIPVNHFDEALRHALVKAPPRPKRPARGSKPADPMPLIGQAGQAPR